MAETYTPAARLDPSMNSAKNRLEIVVVRGQE